MSLSQPRLLSVLSRLLIVCSLVLVPALVVGLAPQVAYAQVGDDDDDDDSGGDDDDSGGGGAQPVPIFFSNSAVGGVAINAQGLLDNAQVDAIGQLRQVRARAMQEQPSELTAWTDLRMVSLKRLESAIEQHLSNGTELPDEIVHLAGLQRIRYVFVDPTTHDIILAGPAEGWTVNDSGAVVGITTGQPVLLLDDLLVALRTAESAANGGITCSIDPTPDGLTRLRSFFARQRTMGNPAQTINAVEQTLGPQNITVTGVPATSHFARVLVAADYRMKRLAMDLEPAPIAGMPSFLELMQNSRTGLTNAMPRWWLATDYDSLLRDAEGLTWELRGAGVKAMTEEDALAADGQIQRGVRRNPTAEKWAQTMTEKYEELAVADPIFGQLRGVMDMAVVAALIVKEQLPEKAGYSMPLLLNPTEVQTVELYAPRTVASQASVTKRRNDWIISASGGVAINSWVIADRVEEDPALAEVRQTALAEENQNWWWN